MQHPNLVARKPITDDYQSIRVSDLTKHPAFKDRMSAPWASFRLSGKLMRLMRDPIEHDWYLDILDYSRNWTQNTISLLQTPCHYGSERHWLECPRCSKRVGVVYFNDDKIGCRKCLGLGYWTQRMNYRTLVPTINRLMKAEKMDEKRRNRTYRGNWTRYANRYGELRHKVGMGAEMYGTEPE